MKRITLETIEAINSEFLTPQEVAPYLGCSAYTINKQIESGAQFPFPAYMLGRHVKIPKRPFVNYHKYHMSENIYADDKIKDIVASIIEQILNNSQNKHTT